MLKDKTLLITGAASGLGKSWAEKFSEEGAKVFAMDINQKGLDELEGYSIEPYRGDVSVASEVKSFVEKAHKSTGTLDIMFNNAGMGFGYRVDSFPDGEFEHHISVHSVSYTHLTLPTKRIV